MSKQYEKQYSKPVVKRKKGKYVENRFLGKLFRLIGYIAVGASSLYYVLKLIEAGNGDVAGFDTIYNLFTQIKLYDVISLDIVVTLIPYLPIFFFGGIILLVWTLSNSTFAKVFTTLFLLAGFLSDYISPVLFHSYPDFLKFIPVESINNLIPADYTNYVYFGLLFLGFLFAWVVFINKKPFRFSSFFLRFGFDIFLIVLIVFGVNNLVPQIKDSLEGLSSVLNYIIQYGSVGAFGLFIISFVFGLLGAFRK